MGRERRQTPADLTERELAALDALLAEPDSVEPDTKAEDVVEGGEPPHPPLESVVTVGDADRRRFLRDAFVALDGPLGSVDESHLAVGDSASFEALIEAREAALRTSTAQAGTE